MNMEDDDDFTGGDENSLELDEVMSLVTIDKPRNRKIYIKLIDEEGDEVPIKEVVQQLMKFILDKTHEGGSGVNEDHYIVSKLIPLAGQAMIMGIPQLVDPRLAMLFVSLEQFRNITANMMVLSFVLIKWIQDKKLKIITVEEPITPEEVERLHEKSRNNSVAAISAVLGMDGKEVIDQLVKSGDVSKDDISELLDDSPSDEDTKDDGEDEDE